MTTNSRVLPALRAGWLALDDRSPRQMLRQAVQFSALFNYVNRAGERSGRWNQFYEREPMVRYAMLAGLDVGREGELLQEWLRTVGPEIDVDHRPALDAAWGIVDRLLGYCSRVQAEVLAFEPVEAERDFASRLRRAIASVFGPECPRVLGCANWLATYRAPGFELAGWTPRDGLLQAPFLGRDGWPAASRSLTFDQRSSMVAVEVTRILNEVTGALLGAMIDLVRAADERWQALSAAPTGLAPHFGLLLAFVQHFKRAQDELNRIPQRLGDYYFRDVLKLQPKPAIGDRVWVAFAPAPGKTGMVPARALLQAGNDTAGQPIVYATTAPTPITRTTLDRLATVCLREPPAAPPAKLRGPRSGFSAAPVANSADGFGAPFNGTPEWATFGELRPEGERGGRFGFAVGSPVLHLEEGRRQIVLSLHFEGPAHPLPRRVCALAPDWQVDYTAPEGWRSANVVLARLIYGEADAQPVARALMFRVRLEPDDPGCVNYDAGRHGAGFAVGTPLLRVCHPNPLAAFVAADGTRDSKLARAFSSTPVSRVHLGIVAAGLEDLLLTGPSGKLASGKPLPLFGAPPQAGGTVVFAKPELLRKRITSLTIQVDWLGLPTARTIFPRGLNDYYASYLAADPKASPRRFDNDQYRVALSARREGEWERLEVRSSLLAPLPPAGELPFLFDWEGARARPVDPHGVLRDRSVWRWWASPLPGAPVAAGTKDAATGKRGLKAGFFSLELVAPDYLFGAPLHAFVLQEVARGELRAGRKTDGPADDSPAGAYAWLSVRVAPSLFARMAKFAGLKPAAWRTVRPELGPALADVKSVPGDVLEAAAAAEVPEPEEIPARLARLGGELFRNELEFRRRIAEKLCLAWPPSNEGNACLDTIIPWLATLVAAPAARSRLALLPNPPLVPTGTVRIARYTARDELVVVAAEGGAGGASFWHLSPLAIYPATVGGATALPPLYAGGSLFLGFRGVEPPASVSLLFVLQPALFPVHAGTPAAPEWAVLMGDRWEDCASRVKDGTEGMLRSGIIRVELPSTVDTAHNVMPPGCVWLRVRVPDPELRLRTRAVLLHAAEAEWVRPFDSAPGSEADHFAQPLAAGAIAALVAPVPFVQKIVQPLPGFGGTPAETGELFDLRVSERLRHKGRAISPSDYERLLLQRHPGVFFARVLPQTSRQEAGRVQILVVPKIRPPDQASSIGFLPGHLREMEADLQALAPLSARVSVINPVLEPVVVDVEVDFRPEQSWVSYAGKLTEDLKSFIAPWIYRQATAAEPRTRLLASDVSQYIRSSLRHYVQAVGECRVGFQAGRDAAVSAGRRDTPWLFTEIAVSDRRALLISAPEHSIRQFNPSSAP